MAPHRPRSGSMGVWPRKRARSQRARIRQWPQIKETKPLGFAGYKAGMTHGLITDNRPHSQTKGQEIFMPMSVIECPPIKVLGIICYQQTPNGLKASSSILDIKADKHIARTISMPKKTNKNLDQIIPSEYHDIRLLVHTQHAKTGIGKKKPEIFELPLGGNEVAAKLDYAKEKLGKEINVQESIAAGNAIDIHAITKGKGFQGPVKRFGISFKQHKSEKGFRAPGSLGGWRGQGHVMYRVAHAGQMGYHQRVDYNKWVVRISEKADDINPKGGFKHYGVVKNSYIIVKVSIPGPSKRLIRS